MKLKIEYVILISVILALALYLGLRKSDRTHYQLPQLAEFTKNNISKIEIQTEDKSLELIKKDNKWAVGPKDYLADDKKVGEMLDALDTLKVTALVSESANYVRYDLSDSKKITIRAWAGSQLKRELDIGKAANTFRHTFIKLVNDKSVYQASGNFRRKFEVDLDQLRDKTVFSFNRDEIHEINIQSGDMSLIARKTEITKKTSGQTTEATNNASGEERPIQEKKFAWQTANGEKLNASAFDNLLSTLSGLSCEKYVENRKKEDFKVPIFKVRLKGIQEHTLSIFDRINKDADAYPAVSSENAYPFMLSKWNADKILKYPVEILKKAERP